VKTFYGLFITLMISSIQVQSLISNCSRTLLHKTLHFTNTSLHSQVKQNSPATKSNIGNDSYKSYVVEADTDNLPPQLNSLPSATSNPLAYQGGTDTVFRNVGY
jgi:hypothetical protein